MHSQDSENAFLWAIEEREPHRIITNDEKHIEEKQLRKLC